MTRILLLTSHPLALPWDSADKQIAHSIVAGLGQRYRYVSFSRLGHPPLPDMRSVQLPIASRDGRPGHFERAQIAALAIAAEPAVDLVHAVMTIGPGFARLSSLRARIPSWMRRPVVHTVPAVVDPDALRGAQPLGTTVVLSESTAALLRDAGFHDVRLLAHGIALDRWPLRPRPTTERQRVLFAGHLDIGGGAAESIEGVAAASGALERAPTLVMALRGRVGQDERSEMEKLQRMAEHAGVQVELHRVVPDMQPLLDQASVVILPARQLYGKADVPLITLEAMASGRPVIVSDLPSMAGLGTAVERVVPGDASALGAALHRLLEDPDEWDRQARAGRALVTRDFAVEAAVSAYAELYGEAIRAA